LNIWIKINPYQNFQDDWHILSILNSISNVAIYYIRKDTRTSIFARIPSEELGVWKKIPDMEIENVQDPPLIEFEHIRKMRMSKSFAYPIVTEKQRTTLFHILEQVDDCIIAVYAKRDNHAQHHILGPVSKRERKTIKATSQTQVKLNEMKTKASDDSFFRCEVIVATNIESDLEILYNSVPERLQKSVKVNQKKFSFRERKNLEDKFDFINYEPKIPRWGKGNIRTPVLNKIELASIIEFPEDISKIRLDFGSYETFTQGPQANVEDTDIIF
jgi:hypothetical protein